MKRRDFLKASALTTGGLLLSLNLPAAQIKKSSAPANMVGPLIQIDTNGDVTIFIYKQEMGQGAATGIAMIAAEELDADWSSTHIKLLSYDKNIENYQSDWGRFDTGGSYSIESEWSLMRSAGASARAMLIACAAASWHTNTSNCRTEKGFVIHTPTGKKRSYGELAQAAANIPVPEIKQFKPQNQYQIIGKPHSSLKTINIVQGILKYSLDIKVPGMLVATIIRPPVLGGKIKRYNAEEALKLPGIVAIYPMQELTAKEVFNKGIRGGLVIVGQSTWDCLSARNKIEIEWDHGVLQTKNCRDLYAQLDAFLNPNTTPSQTAGISEQPITQSHKHVSAEYTSPFIGHGLMEPLNAIADFSDGKHLEIWTGTQSPQHSTRHLSIILGIEKDTIVVHPCFMGGGYGRRFFCDFLLEASFISKEVKRPIQLIWTREDEIQFGHYHPLRKDYYQCGLDNDGNIETLTLNVVTTHEWGGGEMPYGYGLKNLKVTSQHYADSIVPWGSWRGVVPHLDSFSREIFIDELAHAAGKDPIAYRISQLNRPSPDNYFSQHNKEVKDALPFIKDMQIKLLEAVAKLSNWHTPRAANVGLGVAISAYHDRSFCAQVVEVELVGEEYILKKVYTAADVGLVINPNLVRGQIESGIIWGLTPVIHGGVTVNNGRITQSNFHDMPLVKMHETPEMITELFCFEERSPAGAGEFAVTTIAPAISNAIFALSGIRKRHLHMLG